MIDGNAPSVLSVTSTKANGGYKAGETIPISVSFSQIVILTGSNQIMMETALMTKKRHTQAVQQLRWYSIILFFSQG